MWQEEFVENRVESCGIGSVNTFRKMRSPRQFATTSRSGQSIKLLDNSSNVVDRSKAAPDFR